MTTTTSVKKNRKKLWITIIVICCVVIASVAVIRSRSGEIQYFTSPVKRGNIIAVVQATGTINALTTVPVGSSVSGIVKYVFADYNTHVQAGQVLAQLDPTIYEAQVIQARGNLANAQANIKNLEANIAAQQAVIDTNQANVAKLQAALEYSRIDTQRNIDLAKEQIISKDQEDLAVSNLNQADASLKAQQAMVNQSVAQLNQTKAQLQQAHAQVEVMQGALDDAMKNLHDTTIVSPINGVIVARNIDVGQAVAAAFQAPNLFTIAQDLKHMQVDTATDESDTGNIRIGTEATFQVDAFPTETFTGHISAIRLNATTVQNVVTYDTVINFANPEEKLLPGETAYVTVPTGKAFRTVMVPNAALRFKPRMQPKDLEALYRQYHIPPSASRAHLGGTQVVWKLGTNKKLIPVAVEVGITDLTNTQLLKGDLNVGDRLVTGEVLPGNQTFTQGGPRFGGHR